MVLALWEDPWAQGHGLVAQVAQVAQVAPEVLVVLVGQVGIRVDQGAALEVPAVLAGPQQVGPGLGLVDPAVHPTKAPGPEPAHRCPARAPPHRRGSTGPQLWETTAPNSALITLPFKESRYPMKT